MTRTWIYNLPCNIRGTCKIPIRFVFSRLTVCIIYIIYNVVIRLHVANINIKSNRNYYWAVRINIDVLADKIPTITDCEFRLGYVMMLLDHVLTKLLYFGVYFMGFDILEILVITL